jgi:molecular chaperone HscB
MQQMEWREALDEARALEAVERIDDQVAAHEKTLLAALGRALDEPGTDLAQAAQQVRALMFVAKFREDIGRRLEAYDA